MSTPLKPALVFGSWVNADYTEPDETRKGAVVAAYRDAPSPDQRAEVYYWDTDDDGRPVAEDQRGWYGTFGGMTDSVKLTGRVGGFDTARRALDHRIRAAGHYLAEEVAVVPQARTDFMATRVRAVIDELRDMAPSMRHDVAEGLRLAAMRLETISNPYASPPTPTDDPIGDRAAPNRYMASGRETIDEVRDICVHLTGGDTEKASALFAAHCLLTAYVYESRAGRKGDAAQDHAKAKWYADMVAHAMGVGADPRANRKDFTPYSTEGITIPPYAVDHVGVGHRLLVRMAVRFGCTPLFQYAPK